MAEPAKDEPQEMESIEIRIDDDGIFKVGQFIILPDKEAITNHVAQQKKRIEDKGLTAQLRLKGDKEALFRHSRHVIRAAIQAGVNDVLFAADDNKVADAADADKKAKALAANPPTQVTIGIGADDRVAMDGRAADGGPEDRELAQLGEMLEAEIKRHPLGPEGIQVSILTDPDSKHQRIIDVITVLMRLELKDVTFTPDPE